ncbi:zinc finger CCCH domain-containing protein [Musa troglodytarum]|uniref:Zinc finger CCCH domain-containing protein n=1 Tax=Musa troglodytarum TaxID=320322 RepID=A0A9E7JY50_9LILI|nr:zinc finger CCCH domain-containing protein [Musa troglodytarum]
MANWARPSKNQEINGLMRNLGRARSNRNNLASGAVGGCEGSKRRPTRKSGGREQEGNREPNLHPKAKPKQNAGKQKGNLANAPLLPPSLDPCPLLYSTLTIHRRDLSFFSPIPGFKSFPCRLESILSWFCPPLLGSTEMEATGRNGNKRMHQRLGPSQAAAPDRANNKVCYHWRAGRCNRHPCPFLHSEMPTPQQQSAAPDGGVAKRHLVWKNPSNAGAASGPPSKWGKGRGGGAVGRPPGKAPDRVCNYFLAGNCTYGEKCRFLHSWFVSDSFSLLTSLQGHQKYLRSGDKCLQAVSGIALPSGSDKLYSGSKDESVRVWDCQSGQAWNMQTATDLSLDGPIGQVYSLVVGNELLFAGTQVWVATESGNLEVTYTHNEEHSTYAVLLVLLDSERKHFKHPMNHLCTSYAPG